MVDWQFTFRDSIFVQRTLEHFRVPMPFSPGDRLLIKAKPLSGVGDGERVIGSFLPLLFIPGFGEVLADGIPARPTTQLFEPRHEFDYWLIFQPIKRVFSVELSIWSSEMPIYRTITIQPVTSSTATPRKVDSALSNGVPANTELLAVNATRKGATITNTTAPLLYLQMGAVASPTSYALTLNQGDTYEIPYGFTGVVNGLWAATGGSAQVVDLT